MLTFHFLTSIILQSVFLYQDLDLVIFEKSLVFSKPISGLLLKLRFPLFLIQCDCILSEKEDGVSSLDGSDPSRMSSSISINTVNFSFAHKIYIRVYASYNAIDCAYLCPSPLVRSGGLKLDT